MNREIKFRAWDKKDEKITSDFAVFADGRGAGAYDAASSYGDEVYEDYEVMQYTGLKDKNGKEIYEGDIINNDNHGIMQVEWNRDGLAQFTAFNDYMNDELWLYIDNSEIVGNIYENPELLIKQVI